MIDLGTLQDIYTVAKQIYDIVQSIKTAPEAIRELERQIVLVQGVLAALKLDLEGRNDAELIDWSTEPCLKMLEKGHELLGEAETFLQKATKEKDDGSKKVHKFKWVLSGESDAKALATKFQEFHGALSAVHSTIQVQLSRTELEISRHGHRETHEAMHTLAARQEALFGSLSQQTANAATTIQHSVDNIEERIARMEQMMYMASRITLASAANDQSRGLNQAFDEVGSTLVTTQSLLHVRPCQAEPTVHHQSMVSEAAMHCGPPVCGPDCRCRCHKATKSIISAALSSFLGRLYVPRDIRSVLSQPRAQCDEPTCKRHLVNLVTIKYYFPTWFKQINAEIRIEGQSSIHFSLRIPRVVGKYDLEWLEHATLDEVREKLWKRELTVNDVASDGYTMLFAVTGRLAFDRSEAALSILHLLKEYSAPADWEYNGLTPAECTLWGSLIYWGRAGSRKAVMDNLKFRLGPYLSQDIEDAWEELAIKLGWTELHRFLCALSPSDTSILPGLASHINTRDSIGKTPLYYAALNSSEAVRVLLRAGANPRINMLLMGHAALASAYTVVSALVRAGAYINVPNSDEETALHIVASSPMYRYPNSLGGLMFLLELVRHAGHMLDWDMQDKNGDTASKLAHRWLRKNSQDKDWKQILEIYRTRQLPEGAQYIPSPRIVDAECNPIDDNDTGLPPTSLIRAGLMGNIAAIGNLIKQGAMVNERDPAGRTLLHLVALGRVPNGYRVALELVRHGGWGVDWSALMHDANGDWTALQIASGCLRRSKLSDEQRGSLEKVRDLLKARRLPPGEEYLWPCMDPDFSQRMPGAWDGD